MSRANLINVDFEKGRHLFEGLSQPKVSLKPCSIEQDMTLSLLLHHLLLLFFLQGEEYKTHSIKTGGLISF